MVLAVADSPAVRTNTVGMKSRAGSASERGSVHGCMSSKVGASSENVARVTSVQSSVRGAPVARSARRANSAGIPIDN